MNELSERSQTHATFVIQRSYPVGVAAVWDALSENEARDQWFGGGDAFDLAERSHDFRMGGRGTELGQWHGGPRTRFESTYTDIVEQQRIVFTYDMWLDDRHISTSLTTIAVEPDAEGTGRRHRAGVRVRHLRRSHHSSLGDPQSAQTPPLAVQPAF